MTQEDIWVSQRKIRLGNPGIKAAFVFFLMISDRRYLKITLNQAFSLKKQTYPSISKSIKIFTHLKDNKTSNFNI